MTQNLTDFRGVFHFSGGGGSMHLARHLAFMALAFAPFATKAAAEDVPAVASEHSTVSVLAFVGASVRGFQSYPFESTSGDQTFAGLSLAWTPLELPLGFQAGLDGGLSVRHDGHRYGPAGTSVEGWFGPTIRHSGIPLGPLLFRPAVTVGLSAVSQSYGLERQREIEEGGDASVLYYAGLELGLALKSHPNIDLVYRLHHRSGASQVSYLPEIGNIGDTMNAQTVGLRYHF
ncbi:MAG: hypothetical protein WAU68_09510 [Vitreimonas sp.]